MQQEAVAHQDDFGGPDLGPAPTRASGPGLDPPFSAYGLGAAYDEMFDRKACLRPHYAALGARLATLAPGVPEADVRAHLDALARVAEGDPSAGAIATMPKSERFGWLVAPSSTMIQPSEVHTGLCSDPEAKLEELFVKLVG